VKGLLGWGGGVVAFCLVLPLILIASVSGQSATLAQATPSGAGGGLDTSRVPAQYVALVEQAGSMCAQESPALIAAQIQVESAWNPAAVSPAGAQGIAQFMPATWAAWGKDYDHNGTASPLDPGDAIPAQAAFMCELFSLVDAAMKAGLINHGTAEQNALAAYNAGLGAVLAAGGFPTGITETDAYVPNIEQWKLQFTPAPSTVATGTAAAVLAVADSYTRPPLGPLPYVWGAGTLDSISGGADCSAYSRFAFYHGAQLSLPRSAAEQFAATSAHTVLLGSLNVSALQPGDLLFWGSSAASIHHVAVYAGSGQMDEEPHTGAYARRISVYGGDFYGATRPLAAVSS